jgi:hypothetical protein
VAKCERRLVAPEKTPGVITGSINISIDPYQQMMGAVDLIEAHVERAARDIKAQLVKQMEQFKSVPEYVLTLNQGEAQYLRNVLGSIDGRGKEAMGNTEDTEDFNGSVLYALEAVGVHRSIPLSAYLSTPRV